jgi:hypothetical protein
MIKLLREEHIARDWIQVSESFRFFADFVKSLSLWLVDGHWKD